MGKHKSRSKRSRGKPGRTKRRGPSIADRANTHELYEASVQSPESDLEFFSSTFNEIRGRRPVSMREDFCGTANLASIWCRADDSHHAIGIDIDADTLAWGKERHVDPYPAIADRLRLICGDVREPDGGEVDFACALNFSFCVFKTREELRRYFEVALAGLNKEGILYLELYGGTEAIIAYDEDRPVKGFTYHWDQEKFNPITNETLCHIHFSFSDGSRIDRAFTYEWRLWSIPELRELLLEAGFGNVRCYWEKVEADDEDEDAELEGTGEYEEVLEVENQESWIVYIAAEV